MTDLYFGTKIPVSGFIYIQLKDRVGSRFDYARYDNIVEVSRDLFSYGLSRNRLAAVE